MSHEEKPPAESTTPATVRQIVVSPYLPRTQVRTGSGVRLGDSAVPPIASRAATSPKKLSVGERLGLAAGIGAIAFGSAPNMPPQPVITQSAPAHPVAAETALQHFAPQPLSDGEIEQLIQRLTPATPKKPTPGEFDFARGFFRELRDIVTDPGKFAADEAVAEGLHFVVEKAIERVRKRNGDGGSEGDRAKNPIIVVFVNAVNLIVERAASTMGGGSVLTIEEATNATGLSLDRTEAVLKLACSGRSEDGTYWILPMGSC